MGRAAAVLRHEHARRRSGRCSPRSAPGTRFANALPAVGDRWDVAIVALGSSRRRSSSSGSSSPSPRRAGCFPVAARDGRARRCCSTSPGWTPASNVAKIVAFTLVGFWFLQLFEALSWVVLVAAVLIPWVDIASVYRGPTRVVVEEQPGLFERIAIAFALPGEDAAARLGPPDVLFFALFLAAAGTIRPPRRRDVARDDRRARADARRDLRVRAGRAARPARDRARLPPAERGSAVADAASPREPRARRAGRGDGAPVPRRDQQFACAQASMFWVACWTSGGVERLS